MRDDEFGHFGADPRQGDELLLQGVIEIHNRPGGGTSFIFVFRVGRSCFLLGRIDGFFFECFGLVAVRIFR